MAEQILVLLKRNDRVEEIIPYVEKVTQPGMRVVFLVPNPVDRLNWWRDRRIFMEAERWIRLAEGLPAMYPWENRRCLGEKSFSQCASTLGRTAGACVKRGSSRSAKPLRKGLEVSAVLYTGSLRKALSNYALNRDVRLILVRGGIGLWITRFMLGMIPIFGLFKRIESAPMILLRPDHT